MNFGIVLLVFGGFLLGGAWSVWRIEPDTAEHTARPAKGRPGARAKGRAAAQAKGRAAPQIVLAVVLLASALLATASGILRLI